MIFDLQLFMDMFLDEQFLMNMHVCLRTVFDEIDL
jgi:hypothetical protein